MKPNISEKLLECFSKMQVDIALIKQQNENQTTKLDELCEKVKEQNSRVNNLERWRAYVIGLGAAVGVIITEILHGFGRK